MATNHRIALLVIVVVALQAWPTSIRGAPVLVAADGRAVGVIIDIRFSAPSASDDPDFGVLRSVATVVSSRGYPFEIDLADGVPTGIYRLDPPGIGTLFATDDCSDTPIGPASAGATYDVGGALYYSPTDAVATETAYEGRWSQGGLGGSGCASASGTFLAVPVIANVPRRTDILVEYQAPLEVEQRERCLFADWGERCDE